VNMTESTLAVIIQNAIGVVLLIIILLKLLPALRLDTFRQKMFAVRDELFDYAANGNVRFDDPAYRLLRQSMNGFIRYGHQLTFYRMVLTVFDAKLRSKPPEKPWTDKWTHALNALKSERVRNDLIEFHAREMELVTWRVTLGSPPVFAYFVSFVGFEIVRQGISNLNGIVLDLIRKRMSDVVEVQMLEEEAAKSAA
jgi:hypothetical protein